MGLIKSAVQAIGGTFGDQWKDLISCEDMGNDTLMVKKTTPTGQISKDSRIIVAPGQVAVIYDSGSILDATAEEGAYNFDQSTSPSFFAGQFGAVFKEMWQRFTYGGTPAKEQAVFFFNIKEIKDNKFGTGTPIPFQDWSHPIPNQMTGTMSPMRVQVRCYGKYTFKITDPAIFMRNHAGTANVVTKDDLVEQMRSEVIAAFQNVLNELGTSEHKTPVLELPSNTDEIKKTMDEKVFDKPIRDRGLQLVGFAVESVTLDDESSKKIDNYELSSNSFMQQGTLVGAYANAVQDAANNEAGAMNGFMGVGMMNMASGGMVGGAAQTPFANNGGAASTPVDPYAKPQPTPAPEVAAVQAPTATPVAPAPVQEGVKCPNCGTMITGKFCMECGTKAPSNEPKKCPKCGLEARGKFCTECGTKIEE
ncbi:MAG: SPFH domain-containing protein [Bacilli bacterium]|nr:SPFH domain-containing protein [Bacilli bacterium]